MGPKGAPSGRSLCSGCQCPSWPRTWAWWWGPCPCTRPPAWPLACTRRTRRRPPWGRPGGRGRWPAPPARHTGSTGGTPQGTQPLSPQGACRRRGQGMGQGGTQQGVTGAYRWGITFLCHEAVAPFLGPLAGCLMAAHRLFEEFLGSAFPFKHLHVAVLPCSCQLSRGATSLASLLPLLPLPRAPPPRHRLRPPPPKVVRLLASQWLARPLCPDSPGMSGSSRGLRRTSHLYTRGAPGPRRSLLPARPRERGRVLCGRRGEPRARRQLASQRCTRGREGGGGGGQWGLQPQLQVVASDLVSLDRGSKRGAREEGACSGRDAGKQMGAEAFRRVLQRIVFKGAAVATPATSGAPETSSAAAASSRLRPGAQHGPVSSPGQQAGQPGAPFLKEFFPVAGQARVPRPWTSPSPTPSGKNTLELAVRRRSTAPRAPGVGSALAPQVSPKDGGQQGGEAWVHQGWAGMVTVRVQQTRRGTTTTSACPGGTPPCSSSSPATAAHGAPHGAPAAGPGGAPRGGPSPGRRGRGGGGRLAGGRRTRPGGRKRRVTVP